MKMQNAILGLVWLVLVACNASGGTLPNLRGEWRDEDPAIQIIPAPPATENCFSQFIFLGFRFLFVFETTQADGEIIGSLLLYNLTIELDPISFNATVSPDGRVRGTLPNGWKLEAIVVGVSMAGTITASLEKCTGKPKGVATFNAIKKVQ